MCSAQSLVDMDNAHCGKKFRIATHVSPPFIIIDDVTKCVDQKCGPEAFGANPVTCKAPSARSGPELTQPALSGAYAPLHVGR